MTEVSLERDHEEGKAPLDIREDVEMEGSPDRSSLTQAQIQAQLQAQTHALTQANVLAQTQARSRYDHDTAEGRARFF